MGTATTVLTSAQWNAIIDQVNSATASCGGGKLQHVTDPHLWSYTDVMAVQSALKAACSTNTFTTPVGPPYLWLQKIIDEINTARVKGCCNMPPPSYCSQSTISVVSFNPPGTPAYNPKGAPNGATIATMVVQATGTTSAQSVQNLQPVEECRRTSLDDAEPWRPCQLPAKYTGLPALLSALFLDGLGQPLDRPTVGLIGFLWRRCWQFSRCECTDASRHGKRASLRSS